MSPKKSSSSEPPIIAKTFESVDEIDSAIRKLRRRLEEVRELKPASIRHEDHKREAIEVKIRDTIREIYGPNSPEFKRHKKHCIFHNPERPSFVVSRVPSEPTNYQRYFELGIPRTVSILENELISQLEEKRLELREGQRSPPVSSSCRGTKIFIGHGHSPVWKDLRDLLEHRLNLSCDDFEAVSTAGIPHSERLAEMLDNASFAFLVLTGEDDTGDGKITARSNVIHETGLFQGRLGFRRAIVLLEEGCDEFSNIAGLGQIRFPEGNIMAKSEEIRRVLEREGLLST